MRNCLISSLLLLISSTLFAQVNNYYWGKIVGETTSTVINPNSKVVDKNGNIYVLGNFSSVSPTNSLLLPLVPLTTNSLSSSTDGFIMKYNKDGILQWYSLMKGGGADDYVSACLDSNDDLIAYGFTGNTAPMAIISNGTIAQNYTLTSDDYYRAFIAKFSKTDGHIIGSVKYIAKGLNQPSGSTQLISPSTINIFNDTIVLTGIFKGLNIDFGLDILNSTVSGSPSTVKYDIFIETLDTNFNAISLKQFQGGGTGATTSRFTSINKTSDGYYFGGDLFGSTATSPAPLTLPVNGYFQTFESTSINKHDIFIYYTDLNFNGKWLIRSIGTVSNDNKQISNAFIDNAENLTFVGYNSASKYKLSKTIGGGVFSDLTPDLSNNGVTGTSDIILFKFNKSGDLLLNKQIGNSYDQKTFDYALSNDKIAIGGYFLTSLVFGKDTLSSATQDGFLLSLNKSDWSEVGALQFSGTKKETNNLITYNNSNLNYLYGTMETTTNTVTLNTSLGNNVLSNGASYQKSVFLANACPIIGIFENTTTTNLYVDPNKPQTGTIELDVKGDVLGGYSYQWSKKGVDFSRSSSLTDLGPDTTYTVKVDYLGSKCSKTRSFTVLRSITEKSTAFTNSTSCADKDGSITAVVTNNSNGKYTVVEASIDSATWITGIQSGNDYTFNFPALTKGDYQLYYRLTVGTGIYHSLLGGKIFITETGNTITWNSTTVTPIRCNGNTGSIAVSASTTSAGSLTYSVTTSSPPNYVAQNSYSNLTAGTYYINIADGSCEYHAAAVNLTNPAPLTINSTNISTCYSGTTGGISVKAEGGTPPYQYQLMDGGTTVKPFQTSNVFSGLAESTTYTVTVKDVYGCTYTTSTIELSSSNSSIGISLSSIVSHYYNSIIPGKIIVIPEDVPNSTYTYKIDPTGYTQTQSNFENLLPNTYTITILHNAGCSYSEPFVIKDLNQAYPLVYRKPN